MKNAIIYQKEECVLIKTIGVSNKNFAFFVAVNSKKIVYLKETFVNGEVSYASFEKLMQFFPQYQNASSFNTRLIFDTFVNTFNYKIRTGEITNSDEILEFIHQFELFLGDPYINMMIDDNNSRYFNKQAMFEVTNAIKKLSIVRNNGNLAELLSVESTDTNDVFLSQNWLDETSNKDIMYQSILANDKKKKTSPIDFLFNNKVLNIYMVVMVIAVVIFASSLELFMQVKESEKVTDEEIDNIIEEALIEDPVDQTNNDLSNSNVQDPTSNIPPASNSNSNSSNSYKYGKEYWEYMNTSVLNVDFNVLKKKNPDTVAYLYVHNTKVSYPVVQTVNNQFYLNHSFTKKKNVAGWIYADKSCNMKTFDRNTVIYGHGLTDTVMFNTLHNTLKSSWYKNKNNQIIKLSTPTSDTLWQIVSIYTIKEENYYLKVKHRDDKEYAEWIKTIVGRSIYNFGHTTSIKNKFLTLSTCKDRKGNRIVIHAILVREDKK